jgi:hypothetical protein
VHTFHLPDRYVKTHPGSTPRDRRRVSASDLIGSCVGCAVRVGAHVNPARHSTSGTIPGVGRSAAILAAMTLAPGADAARPARRRRAAAKAVLVGAASVQIALIVRGGGDPHKLFAFRPFNESDTWQVDIVRVLADGSRHSVDDGTWVYDWDELVGTSKLRRVDRLRHASAGARASVDFLERALDWALDHIPDDVDTVALEATVVVFHNTRGPEVVLLRSVREPSR